MARTVSIGEQYFGDLIGNGCFYVDKTNFIKEWWENRDKVTLITRPRRFGKTLTMSMLEHFFSLKYAGRGSLFEGLSIWEDETYRMLQGTYPVIFLSFANIKGENYPTVRESICQLLIDLFSEYEFLLDSGILAEEEKKFFKRITSGMGDSDASLAVHQLSKYLSRCYGKKAVVLLDEYDAPMQEAYVNGYWNELSSFTRRLLNATFKTNPYLERGLLTGITRVSKESIFSDLNNLEVVTTTSRKYETAFGFTETELQCALKEFDLLKEQQAIKEWYDGFRFGECSSIYNPWSIINFLDKKVFMNYWANSSSNRLISDLIQKSSADIKMTMEDLLQGKSFRTSFDEEIVFSQLDHSENAVWSMLLASGYLKVISSAPNSRGKLDYELTLTNLEIKNIFEDMFIGWFSDGQAGYHNFEQALLRGSVKEMNVYMNKVSLHTFSCFDTGKKPSEAAEPERFYHGFVLGLIADLRNRYDITSNRESGFGRYDVMLSPTDGRDDGIILEFKVLDPDDEGSLQDTAGAALEQIVSKKYAAALEAAGVPRRRIRIYGFAFSGKEVLIEGGCLQDYE